MGNTVIDSRGAGNPIANALSYYLNATRERQAREDEERRQRERQEQADRNMRLQFAQAELAQVHPSQRSAYIQRMAPDLQGYFTDPSALPPPQYTPGEMATQEFDKRRLAIAQGYDPSTFDQGYAFMESVIGRNPNAEYTKALRDKSFMEPETFQTYADEGFTPRSDVLKNEAAAAKDTAEAAFTAGPKTSTEYAQGGLYGAQTGESRARTGKLAEETITEREGRDPNSPTSRAKANSAGRKSSAQVALETQNATLAELDKQRNKIVLEIEGEKAALAAQKAPATPFLRKKEGELRAVDVLRNDTIKKRDRIVKGMKGAGVAPAQPAPQPGPAQPTFTPEQERGIAAIMAAGKMTREQAIQYLQQNGRL